MDSENKITWLFLKNGEQRRLIILNTINTFLELDFHFVDGYSNVVCMKQFGEGLDCEFCERQEELSKKIIFNVYDIEDKCVKQMIFKRPVIDKFIKLYKHSGDFNYEVLFSKNRGKKYTYYEVKKINGTEGALTSFLSQGCFIENRTFLEKIKNIYNGILYKYKRKNNT